jgi:hypothetical protein
MTRSSRRLLPIWAPSCTVRQPGPQTSVRARVPVPHGQTHTHTHTHTEHADYTSAGSATGGTASNVVRGPPRFVYLSLSQSQTLTRSGGARRAHLWPRGLAHGCTPVAAVPALRRVAHGPCCLRVCTCGFAWLCTRLIDAPARVQMGGPPPGVYVITHPPPLVAAGPAPTTAAYVAEHVPARDAEPPPPTLQSQFGNMLFPVLGGTSSVAQRDRETHTRMHTQAVSAGLHAIRSMCVCVCMCVGRCMWMWMWICVCGSGPLTLTLWGRGRRAAAVARVHVAVSVALSAHCGNPVRAHAAAPSSSVHTALR